MFLIGTDIYTSTKFGFEIPLNFYFHRKKPSYQDVQW